MTLASSPAFKFIYLKRGRYCLNLKWQHNCTPGWIQDLRDDGELQTGVRRLSAVMGSKALGLVLPAFHWCRARRGKVEDSRWDGGGAALPAHWTFLLFSSGKIKTCLDDYILHMKRRSASSTEKLQMNVMEKLDKNNEREVKKLLFGQSRIHGAQQILTWTSSRFANPGQFPRRL